MQKKITLEQGQTITLNLTEEWDIVTFYENGQKLDGEFCFHDQNEDGTSFLLKRMYSPNKYKRKGLGEEALKFFKEETGDAIIWTREIGDSDRNDGSHLTGNAPSFVMKMQKKGLIAQWDNGGED